MQPPSVATMQRLAFVRYLAEMGVRQSQEPEPFAAIAVLSFHDAVELFLQLAAEQVNCKITKKIEFLDYFQLIDNSIAPMSLAQRAAMKRLNDARVGLKHHGMSLAKQTVVQIRSSVEIFLEVNTKSIFNLDFGSVSLVDMVHCESARENLRRANELMTDESFEQAMTCIALAFAQLVDDYESKMKDKYKRSPYPFDSFHLEFALHRRRTAKSSSDRQAIEDEKNLIRAVQSIQDSMKTISLGLDYPKYMRFRLMTPTVIRMYGGGIYYPSDARACRIDRMAPVD